MPTGMPTGMTVPAGSHDRRPLLIPAGIAALGVTVALTATSVIVPVLLPDPVSRGQRELRHYFDVTADSSLPAWWATSLLLAAALAHAMASFATRVGRVGGAWCWSLGAVVLAVLSLDEHALLSERLETLGAALVAVTGFGRPILAAGVASAVVVAVALVLLTVRERRRTGWLLVTGAILLTGSSIAGAPAAGSVLVTAFGWLGRIVGVLLLAAAAMSAVSLDSTTTTSAGRSGSGCIRIRHHAAGHAVSARPAVPVPAAGRREDKVPEPLMAAEAES